MPISIDQAEKLIQEEYNALCTFLKLEPVGLDVYMSQDGSQEITPLGTPVKNDTPLYGQGKIILPFSEYDLSILWPDPISFPPTSWDVNLPYVWPQWRVSLWHEVTHQIEDHVIKGWKPGVEGGPAWEKAVGYFAERCEISINTFKGILQGFTVRDI